MLDLKSAPFHHQWVKEYQSIFNPLAKVTFPQLITEMVINNRSKLIRNYPKIIQGKGWSKQVLNQIRPLILQASVVCNFFPNPKIDKVVFLAFKNVINNRRIINIGQYRKNRIGKNGQLTITEKEKEFITYVSEEYNRLKDSVKFEKEKIIRPNIPLIQKTDIKPKSFSLAYSKILEIENKKCMNLINEVANNGTKT